MGIRVQAQPLWLEKRRDGISWLIVQATEKDLVAVLQQVTSDERNSHLQESLFLPIPYVKMKWGKS